MYANFRSARFSWIKCWFRGNTCNWEVYAILDLTRFDWKTIPSTPSNRFGAKNRNRAFGRDGGNLSTVPSEYCGLGRSCPSTIIAFIVLSIHSHRTFARLRRPFPRRFYSFSSHAPERTLTKRTQNCANATHSKRKQFHLSFSIPPPPPVLRRCVDIIIIPHAPACPS